MLTWVVGCGGTAVPTPVDVVPPEPPVPAAEGALDSSLAAKVTCAALFPREFIEMASGHELVDSGVLSFGGPGWSCHQIWNAADVQVMVGGKHFVVSIVIDDEGYDYVRGVVDPVRGEGYAEVDTERVLGDASVLAFAHEWTEERWKADQLRAEEETLAALSARGQVDPIEFINEVGRRYTPSSHALGAKIGHRHLHMEFEPAYFSVAEVRAVAEIIGERLKE